MQQFDHFMFIEYQCWPALEDMRHTFAEFERLMVFGFGKIVPRGLLSFGEIVSIGQFKEEMHRAISTQRKEIDPRAHHLRVQQPVEDWRTNRNRHAARARSMKARTR